MRELRNRKRRPKPLMIIEQHPQYDREDGSVLSGDYSPEPSPSLIMSAQGLYILHKQGSKRGSLISLGVEMMDQPINFTYSYPQGAIALDREAFGYPECSQRVADWLSSSVASSPVVFTEVSSPLPTRSISMLTSTHRIRLSKNSLVSGLTAPQAV